MPRRIALLTALTLLLATVSVPVSAKQPADIAAHVDAALQAKVLAAVQAQEALKAAPGQSATKIAEREAARKARLKERLAKLADGKGSDRSMEVHKILAAGKCNPGQGDGQKIGHQREGHRWSACKAPVVGPYSGPPGHDPDKVKEDDDQDD